MAARKLQQEMDRVFKRVSEGIAAFDGTYDKLQMASGQAQKEKIEQDLKREIKKLQKLRDQIKTWIGSNDIRDKNQLFEQRKLIENEMERFKIVEREVKTKAYSKIGLNKDDRLDPHEKEKREACDFIQNQIDKLEQQIDELDTEQESLQGSMKKGKRDAAKQERISEIDFRIERNKWHIFKMEIMLRMIDNDTLASDSVMSLQEDILYYVESNQDVDFAEDEAIYDDLNLVEDTDEEENLAPIVRDDTYTLEDLAQDLSKEKEKGDRIRDREKDKELLFKAKETDHEKERVREREKDKETEKERVYDNEREQGTEVHRGRGRDKEKDKNSEATVEKESDQSKEREQPSSLTSIKKERLLHGLMPLPPPPDLKSEILRRSTPPTAGQSPMVVRREPSSARGVGVNLPASNVGSAGTTASITEINSNSYRESLSSSNLTFPPSLQDLANPLNFAKSRLMSPPSISLVFKQIESSYLHCPDAIMADRPQYYHPESPYPTPDFYPSEPLSTLDDPIIFSKMDVDTLFYIFYYRQGTYQQFLAACELKNRNWRFHKRFLTWFQRHEEPKLINTEFEQGTYRFFDFEGSWLQRRKSSFKFEYQYLEDEI